MSFLPPGRVATPDLPDKFAKGRTRWDCSTFSRSATWRRFPKHWRSASLGFFAFHSDVSAAKNSPARRLLSLAINKSLSEEMTTATTMTTSRSARVIVIGSTADIEDGLRERRRDGDSRLRIRMPGVSRIQALAWERGLETALQECGCRLGSVCAILGGCAGSALYLHNYWTHTFHLSTYLYYSLLPFGAGAVACKLLSLYAARLRIRRIRADISATSGTDTDGTSAPFCS